MVLFRRTPWPYKAVHQVVRRLLKVTSSEYVRPCPVLDDRTRCVLLGMRQDRRDATRRKWVSGGSRSLLGTCATSLSSSPFSLFIFARCLFCLRFSSDEIFDFTSGSRSTDLRRCRTPRTLRRGRRMRGYYSCQLWYHNYVVG